MTRHSVFILMKKVDSLAKSTLTKKMHILD